MSHAKRRLHSSGAAGSFERGPRLDGGFFSLDGDIGVSSDNNKRRDPDLGSVLSGFGEDRA